MRLREISRQQVLPIPPQLAAQYVGYPTSYWTEDLGLALRAAAVAVERATGRPTVLAERELVAVPVRGQIALPYTPPGTVTAVVDDETQAELSYRVRTDDVVRVLVDTTRPVRVRYRSGYDVAGGEPLPPDLADDVLRTFARAWSQRAEATQSVRSLPPHPDLLVQES